MSTVITATELKKNLGHYLDLVQKKQEVFITKNGHKIARLAPYITDVEEYFIIKEEADERYGGLSVSYEEFMEMYENTEQRMEYIDGEIYLLASPTITHQKVISFLHYTMVGYFSGKTCDVFFSPFDVHFYKKSMKNPDVMQPDLLVICDLEENTNGKDKYMGTPTLVVEVLSDSTRSKDMLTKLNTYMLSGVREYWIIDSRDGQVLVYSFKEAAIDHISLYKKGDTIKSYCFEDLEVEVDDVL